MTIGIEIERIEIRNWQLQAVSTSGKLIEENLIIIEKWRFIHSLENKKLYRQQTTFSSRVSYSENESGTENSKLLVLFLGNEKEDSCILKFIFFLLCICICKNRKILQNCVVFKDFVYLSLHPGLCPWIFFIFFLKRDDALQKPV